MTDWVPIGRPDAFREGRGRVVVVLGVRVAVFRVGPSIHAMRDACPHMGLSLAEASPEGGRVTCHGHGWTFDLATGRSDRRSGACARVYAVRIENDQVLVRPPAEEHAPEPAEIDWVPWDNARHGRSRASAPSDGSPHGEERGRDTDQDPGREDDDGHATR